MMNTDRPSNKGHAPRGRRHPVWFPQGLDAKLAQIATRDHTPSYLLVFALQGVLDRSLIRNLSSPTGVLRIF